VRRVPATYLTYGGSLVGWAKPDQGRSGAPNINLSLGAALSERRHPGGKSLPAGCRRSWRLCPTYKDGQSEACLSGWSRTLVTAWGFPNHSRLSGDQSGVACPSAGDGHATHCTSSRTVAVRESTWN